MAENFGDFIENVRDANPIEDVIQEDGFPLKGYKLMQGAREDCDSLTVRTDWQRAWWYSKGEWNGDVFGWVQRQRGCDFMEALELLARRSGLEMPKFSGVNEGEYVRRRATADAFSVAAEIFHRWLLADDPALAYVRGRGWTDETTELALTGFSGRNTKAQKDEMVDEFLKLGVDRFSAAAVAVTGFTGDVTKWAESKGLLDDPEFDKGWIEKGHIHGLMGNPGVVYAHQKPLGKVVFLSRRNMPGFEGTTGKWKSHNPQRGLIGEKQFYYNHLYKQGEPLVMVEGQGDAITWGQWGFASLAFCGLVGKVENMAAERRENLERLVAKIRKYHPVLYYAPDNDEAGENAISKMGRLFGPTLQIVRYSPTSGDTAALLSAGKSKVESEAVSISSPPTAKAASPQIQERDLGGENHIEENIDEAN